MSSLNKVFLMGNLTRDPDLRYTPKGTAVSDLGMAINMNYKGADGTDHEETVYVDVVVWGRQAETCNQCLAKGSGIFVEGRLQLDQWQDKDGQKKSRLRVRGERVHFLTRLKSSGGEHREPREYAERPERPERPAAPRRPAAQQPPAPPPHDEPHHYGEDPPF